MTQFKTYNDCFCGNLECDSDNHISCYQPADFFTTPETKETTRWYCPECLLKLFGIDVSKDKTTWGEIISKRDY